MTPPRKKPGGRKPTINPELLREDLPVSRERFVDLSRDYLSILKKSVVDFRAQGIGGRVFTRDYSRIVDAIVGVLFQRAVQDHGSTTEAADIAVIGMGGYGRQELAPYSDVDILVLCKRRTALVREIASTFVRLMWDVGFELGHSVESLIESESTLFRHMDTRTALYESRWVCGSKQIAAEIENQIKRMRRKDREAFLERKIKDAVARHNTHSNSYQLIEPNVKLSPGGLRDYQTLVWLGMVSHGDIGLSALRRKGLLLPGDAQALEKAYDFLLRVRVELHLATESKQDQLTVRMQRAIAGRLGYRSRGGHLAVELFMRDYYNHTRTVFGVVDEIIEELQGGKSVGVLLGQRKVPKAENRLDVRVSRSRLRKEPLYVFFKQKKAGLRLGRPLKRRLASLLAEELKGQLERNLMRRQFPNLLETGQNLSLVLRSMHETGFLAAVIPEYKELTSLKRYDLYHHYTVDEHSFQVLANLEMLAMARRSDPLCRIYSEISNKRILFLTALLHDIGKIEGRGHAKKGAVLSRKILKRMGIKHDDAEMVAFLIEHHLLMSHYAQRRDPGDLGTLRAFSSVVRGRTNLKYLTLITYADLKATSPIVWTEWKRSLLWTLYLKAHEFMTKTKKEPETVYKAHKQSILRGFRVAAKKAAALAHLDMLPGRYLLTMGAPQVREHMRLIDELAGKRAVVSMRSAEPATEITFCTLDKPFRLSQLCGVLTVNDCNILFAHAFTRRDGKVLDVFHVEDFSGTVKIDDARIEHIQADLDTVLRGKHDLNTQVERHVQKWKRRKETAIPVPLKIEFENDISPDVTIIDIFAMDEPGLLFKITRALSEEGLVIHRARISTEANRVIDSFDVQDRKGQKVTAATRLRQIRLRLQRALAGAK
jgi:[protein-PII] uridylyltransferase